MNPIEKMNLVKENFSETDLKIYDKIQSDPYYIIKCGIVALAVWCDVSQPAVTRFCKKIGYQKFTDFKHEMYQYVSSLNQNNDVENTSTLSQTYTDIIYKTEQILTPDFLKNLANQLRKFDHIYVSGLGESSPPAILLEIKLRKLGLKISYLSSWDLIDAYNYVGENDLVLLFSVRGGYSGNIFGEFFQQRASLKGQIFLVTMNPNSYYKEHCDNVIVLPYSGYSDSLERPSEISFYIFVEKLVSSIAFSKVGKE